MIAVLARRLKIGAVGSVAVGIMRRVVRKRRRAGLGTASWPPLLR